MNTLIEWDNKLAHAPAGVVVALFAIVLGYVLKSSAFFPNNRIPLVIVCVTAIVFPVVQLCEALKALTGGAGDGLLKEGALLSVPQNVLAGVIIGFLAWTFHAQILRRWIDPKMFNDDGSAKFLTKPTTPISAGASGKPDVDKPSPP